jgi:ribonuclease D
VCWSPPEDGDVAGALRAGGARPWQVQLVAPILDEAAHTSA